MFSAVDEVVAYGLRVANDMFKIGGVFFERQIDDWQVGVTDNLTLRRPLDQDLPASVAL